MSVFLPDILREYRNFSEVRDTLLKINETLNILVSKDSRKTKDIDSLESNASTYILKSILEAANDMIVASAASTPAKLSVGASSFVGRGASGNVAALTGAEAWTILGKETALTDYSSTSTVVGFSAFNTKVIKYGVIGNIVVCIFGISGTSNGGGFSFTLPIAAAASSMYTAGVPMIAQDNGVYLTTFARIYMDSGGSTVLCQKLLDGTGWTGSGTKACYGTITYLKG